MERLTDKFKCKYNAGKTVNAHNASKQQVIDRLAAYEDTGLTPAEFEAMKIKLAQAMELLELAVVGNWGMCETCMFSIDCAKHDGNDETPFYSWYTDCEDWQWQHADKLAELKGDEHEND